MPLGMFRTLGTSPCFFPPSDHDTLHLGINFSVDSHSLSRLKYGLTQTMSSDPDWESVKAARQLKRDKKMVSLQIKSDSADC